MEAKKLGRKVLGRVKMVQLIAIANGAGITLRVRPFDDARETVKGEYCLRQRYYLDAESLDNRITTPVAWEPSTEDSTETRLEARVSTVVRESHIEKGKDYLKAKLVEAVSPYFEVVKAVKTINSIRENIVLVTETVEEEPVNEAVEAAG